MVILYSIAEAEAIYQQQRGRDVGRPAPARPKCGVHKVHAKCDYNRRGN